MIAGCRVKHHVLPLATLSGLSHVLLHLLTWLICRGEPANFTETRDGADGNFGSKTLCIGTPSPLAARSFYFKT